MKYNKKTHRRKNSKKQLTRKKTKGGAPTECSKATSFDRFVIKLWSSVQHKMRESGDLQWKFDQHKNIRHGSCNLWGWLRCHTSRDNDTHWDLYFIDRDTIGLSLTFRNRHNYYKAIFDIDYDGIYYDYDDVYDTDSYAFSALSSEIASWVNEKYWEWVFVEARWYEDDCHY